MRISKLSPVTKIILDELRQKHTIFDLKDKVNLSLHAVRQTVVRLMKSGFVFTCESKIDEIKKRKMKSYTLTEKGKNFLKKVEEFVPDEEESNCKKRLISFNPSSLRVTKSFIKTLTKKATPWDGLLNA